MYCGKLFRHLPSTSMVVHDLHILGPGRGPSKHDPPLIVDSDGVPSSQVSPQSFEAIARGNGKINKCLGIIQLNELTPRYFGKIDWESLWSLAIVQDHLGPFAFEAPDHRPTASLPI